MSIVSEHIDVDLSNTANKQVFDSDAFKNKILNIIETNINSMPFYRQFGTSIDTFLFRSLSYSTGNLLMLSIESSILGWYPKAKVEIVLDEIDFVKRTYPLSITISHPKLLEPITLIKEYQSHV